MQLPCRTPKVGTQSSYSQFLVSNPQESFPRRVCRKLFSFSRIRLSVNDSLRTASCTCLSTISFRESSAQIKWSALPSISKEMMLLSGTMMGRTFRLCGATGVITKLADSGNTTGPPQLSEYPVEPVGVATISPSAQYVFRNSPYWADGLI